MKVGYPNIPPGISKLYIGSLLRGTAGAQAITGVGFVPKVVLFFGMENTLTIDAHSHGFDTKSQQACNFKRGGVTIVDQDTTRSIVVYKDAANIIRGYITSMDADGFTITWDLTGGVTASVIYLAMR